MRRECGNRNAESGMALTPGPSPANGRGETVVPRSSFIVHRFAMTLVELLVVLAILALLTAVAVTSSDVVLSQGRHEATVRTLRAIEEAVLGPQNASSTSDEPAAGFLADIGRLPRMVSEATVPGIGLAELWTNPGTMAAYQILRPTSGDTEVAVGCGWRGPYLRLPVGRGELLDGWGHAFVLLNSAENAAGASEEIFSVRSHGADGEAGTGDDLVLSLATGVDLTVGGHVRLFDSEGQPKNFESGSTVRVVLYGPNKRYVPGGSEPAIKEFTRSFDQTTTNGVSAVSYSSIATEESGITAGPRYLRAYQDTPTVRKSKVVRIQRGGVVDLEIR